MNARVFANTSTLQFETQLDGGGTFSPPTVLAYSTLFFRFKLSEDVGNATALDPREVLSSAARLGWEDEKPRQGTCTLTITLGADSVTTGDIAFDADDDAVKAAIDAALENEIPVLHPCTVTTYQGGQRIAFADPAQQPTITCQDNALWPMSFVDVDAVEFDSGWAFIYQLRQVPVAETVDLQEVPVAAPVITELQAGSSDGETEINAIQKLFIPPTFTGGSFRIIREGSKTDPIVVPVTDVALIGERLAPLADEDSNFLVTQVDNGAYIEFQGEMGGQAQPLLTVEIFEDPKADYLIRLATKTDAMRTLMRGAEADGTLDVPFNLDLEIEDGVNEGERQPLSFVVDIPFRRPVSDNSHNVAADLKWNQPLSRVAKLRHTPDTLILAKRAMQRTIGDGVATEFSINHNLVENSNDFTVDAGTDVLTAAAHGYEDFDPVALTNTGGALPAEVSESNTYFILNATLDTFQLSTAPNGAPIDFSEAGTGTHQIRLKDGTVELPSVEVWETSGDQRRVSPSDYSVERESVDAIKVSSFASTPTANQYTVIVQAFGRPSTHLAHRHETLEETPEAKARIEALEAAVAELQATFPANRTRPDDIGGRYKRERPIKPFGSVFPTVGRSAPTILPNTDLASIDDSALGVFRPTLFGAVHDAAVEELPTTGAGDATAVVPATPDLVGRVFENQTEADLFISADGRGYTLKPGEFAASNGIVFYPVEQYGSAVTTSYFPAHQVRELWKETIEAEELIAGREYRFRQAVGLKVIGGNAPVYCRLVIEIADLTEETDPATTGPNLLQDAWLPDPVFSQPLTLTDQPVEPVIGYRVTRKADGSLEASKFVYGKWYTTTAPATARFGVRVRLIGWDTPATPNPVTGYIAYSGPGRASENTATADSEIGFSIVD